MRARVTCAARIRQRLVGISIFPLMLVSQGILLADQAPEEKEIHATAESYVKAFNAADVEAILSLWSDDGDYVDVSGKAYRGKDAIGKELKDFFATYPCATMKIVIDTIHIDSPGLAIEDGLAQVLVKPNSATVNTRYTVVHVKEGDQWKMQSVREGAAAVPSNYDQLKGLEWMVGNWIDQGEHGDSVQSSCGWSVNKNFLVRTFTSVFEGGNATSGSQTIAWDPGSKAIKSWTFDTNGGITEGIWSNDGEKWLCKISTVLRSGERFSGTEVMKVIDANTHTWQSVDRKIGDQDLPDTEVVTVHRQ